MSREREDTDKGEERGKMKKGEKRSGKREGAGGESRKKIERRNKDETGDKTEAILMKMRDTDRDKRVRSECESVYEFVSARQAPGC